MPVTNNVYLTLLRESALAIKLIECLKYRNNVVVVVVLVVLV